MSAPAARRVCQLTGQIANEKFFAALSEADALIRDRDDLDGLRVRNQELWQQVCDQATEIETLTAERNDWRNACVRERVRYELLHAERHTIGRESC